MTVNKFLVFSLLLSGTLFAQDLVTEGTWTTIDYAASGEWRIEKSGDDYYFSVGKDFVTTNGPDLFILFSKLPLNKLTNENTNANSVVVGQLKTTDKSALFKKMKGPQKLKIPADVNVEEYKTVVIHCVEYSHLWAGADLKP